MTTSFKDFKQSSGLYGGNASYVEELYEQYLQNPQAVSEYWQRYFSTIKADSSSEVSRLAVQEKFAYLAQLPAATGGVDSVEMQKQIAVLNLIAAYRYRAHRSAEVDPVDIRERRGMEEFEIKRYGLDENDLDKTFQVDGAFGQQQMTLKTLIAKLEKTYNHHIGLEFGHVWEKEEHDWFIEQMEATAGEFNFSAEQKERLLKQLVRADGLEKYLHRRYVGQKRFSLEGGDALIPLTQAIIDILSDRETEEVGIAMAHRGRLNMLINILGKTPQALFDEFEGKFEPAKNRSGDVKYHMGFSSRMQTDKGTLDISLAYNPSHLEFVNAVQMGSTRARLERQRMKEKEKSANEVNILEVANRAVPILIHGDAALAGQGINQEVLQLAQLRGYQVGGSVHIVVNNQIGFTTSNLEDARSSMYCTDIAKSTQVPVFHVNGDDPEAVVFAGRLAIEYLLRFQKDVFIDLVCYRRLGHNEADEPSATQPIMYQKIRNHPVPAEVYAQKLLEEGIIEKQTLQTLQENYQERLANGESVALAEQIDENKDKLAQEWKALRHQDWEKAVDTKVDLARLQALGEKTFSAPESFKAHKIVNKILATRRDMIAGKQALDWGAAENLAYATLLDEGYLVRLSGEDSGRGTFSHRHAVLHDQETGESYLPLAHLKDNQPSVRVIDSLLSEMGALGFEYGYATAEPKGLIVWEAQFGDFANAAQVIIDQFIASGETKWGRYCGLVMLLPHGYEGQGPEHSSARLERFLQLCAKDNMIVAMPTTPAQIFHLLRLQVLREFRKPLIVMSPKSLLRHKLAVSEMEALAEDQFERVIGEINADIVADKVRRVVLCSGKVYYDLLQKRREDKISDVALIRLEQLYPFPLKEVKEILAQYPEQAQYVWVQEEPRNQGAWLKVLESTLDELGSRRLHYIGREESASTAAGYTKVHNAEQAALVDEALKVS